MHDTNAPPAISLHAQRDKRAHGGHPWIYSNEIQMTAETKALPPGTVAIFRDAGGKPIAQGFFNPHSLIAGRVLTRNTTRRVDAAFLAERLGQALDLRRRLGIEIHGRIVHAEADRLPGLIIDRMGPVVVVQSNTAGMDRLEPTLVRAITETLAPEAIVLRNDSASRAQEGLSEETRLLVGALDGAVAVEENGCRFWADPLDGQKTGWYFDQRENRARVAALCAGQRVLDLYCHTGGFAVTAARAGARSVVAVDRSGPALALASRAAADNGLDAICAFERAEVFADAERRLEAKERYDVVVADPPPFARTRKDLEAAAKGYRKLARLAAALVAPGGFLFIASCSYNMPADRFLAEVNKGLGQAGRAARVLAQTGAAMDHPVHPLLPETAYLKGLLLALD